MGHRIVATLVGAALVAAATADLGGQSLTARTVRFDSTALGSQATFAVLLPADYETSGRRYPVVYLLHGGTQNHTAFPARAWFAKEVSRRGVIAVMPHVPQSTYLTRGSGGPAFEAFITSDLVQYVDMHYPTVVSRNGRAIGGLSMGGYGAVMAGLKRPDLFATVGAFSGAFSGGREAAISAAVESLDPAAAPFFYISCGVADAVLPASRQFVKLLDARDIAHEYREVPGGHTWEVWDPQTLAFLDLLLARFKSS